MRCPFQKLPIEIHLIIFKSVEDLLILHDLLLASAVLECIFAAYPGEVITAISGKLTKELQQIIRAVAVGFCAPALDVSLIQSDIISNSGREFRQDNDEEEKTPPISFSDLPLPAIRQLLTSAHRIHVLANSFLQTYIDRLNNLRPYHVANTKYTEPFLTRHCEIFQNPLEGRRYTPLKTGPASWVEEYRVVRALWRLQLSCLFTYGPWQPASVGEISAESSNLKKQTQFYTLWHLLSEWECDEMECLSEHFDSLGISFFGTPSGASLPPSTRPIASKLTHPPTSPASEFWWQDRSGPKHRACVYNFFQTWGRRGPHSSLKRSCWIHFRRLGFGIWDTERMCAMELYRLPQR